MRPSVHFATWSQRTCFQILAFMAMEPPTPWSPTGPIGEEKNKVFRSMLPLVARQCGAGAVHGLSRGARR